MPNDNLVSLSNTQNNNTPNSSDGELDTSGISDLDVLNNDDSADNSESEEEEEDDTNDSEETPDESEEENEEDSDEEESEEEESEEDDEESEEDSDDDNEEVEDNASLYKTLKAKYKNIFTEVPQLRPIIAREAQFSEIFNNPTEAKAVSTKATVLDHLTKDIKAGTVESSTKILKAISGMEEGALAEFAHTLLPAIGQLDANLYGEIITNPFRKALQRAFVDGQKAQNKQLMAAAKIIHEYYLDGQDIASPIEERKKAEKSKGEKELEEKISKFENQKLTDFRNDVVDATRHSLRNVIKKALVDVKDSSGNELSEYIKRNLINDILNEVDKTLGQDTRHITNIRSMFEQAKSASYSTDWKSRLISTYLARAKQALPAVKSKALKEAGLKGNIKKEVRRLTPGLGGKSSDNKSASFNSKNIDWSKTTDMDILNDTPKLKK